MIKKQQNFIYHSRKIHNAEPRKAKYLYNKFNKHKYKFCAVKS